MSKNYKQTGVGQSTEFGKQGSRVATNPVAPSGQRIEMRENDDVTPSRTSGAPAVEPDDYITFAQFQAQSKWIDPVRALSDVNETLSGVGGSIDGVGPLADGDRVALTNQTNPVENGVWIVRAAAWERPLDFADGLSASNRTFFVQEGTDYEDTAWTVTTDPPADIIGTDPLALVQIASGAAATQLQNIGAGVGLLGAGIQGPGLINLSVLAEGPGTSIVGGGGVGAATIATLLQNIVAGGPGGELIPSTPAPGSPFEIRKLKSAGASIAITVDGDGNLNLEALTTPAPLYEATFFVDPNGSPLATGRNPSEPTTYANAISQANAFAGVAPVLISLAAGEYSDGDGPATGTTTITRVNVSISGIGGEGTFNAVASSRIIDTVSIQSAGGFSAEGVGFLGIYNHNGDVGAVTYRDCSFGGDLFFNAPGNDTLAIFTGCAATAFTTTGLALGGTFFFEGGEGIGDVIFGHSGTAPMIMRVNGVGRVNSVQLSQSSTGFVTYRAFSVPRHGVLESTAPGNNEVFLTDVTFDAVNASSESIDLEIGEGRLEAKDCVLNTAAARGAIHLGAGYLNNLIADTFYNQQSSTFSGTLATPTDAAEADQFSPEFANSMKVRTEENPSAPFLLTVDPAKGNLVERIDAAALSAGLPYDTIYYVSLTGDPLNDGLTVNEPTDLATALAAANAAGGATVALLDQGTYTTGGTISITGDGVSIVSFFEAKWNGTAPVIVSDDINVDAPGFTAKGIALPTVNVNAGGAAFQSCLIAELNINDPSDWRISAQNCTFLGGLVVLGAASGDNEVIVDESQFEAGAGITLSHSGTGDLLVGVAGTTTLFGGISLNQSSSGSTTVNVVGCGLLGPVTTNSTGTGSHFVGLVGCSQIAGIELSHSSTGSSNLRVASCGGIGDIGVGTSGADTTFQVIVSNCGQVGNVTFNYTSVAGFGPGNAFFLSEVALCAGVTAIALGSVLLFQSDGVRFDSDVNLDVDTGGAFFQSSVINGLLNIGASWDFSVLDTSFDPNMSTLDGTEIVSSVGPSSQFSSMHVMAQPFGGDPGSTDFDLLFRGSLSNRGFVQSISSTNFQKALNAGQGIDPTLLPAPTNTVATANPESATNTPGVPLIQYQSFTSQGDGTLSLGGYPPGTRITKTELVIDSTTNTVGNANLGFATGTGTELQNGATDNDVTVPATYEVDDRVLLTAGQTVELELTGFDGVISGDVIIHYFIGA